MGFQDDKDASAGGTFAPSFKPRGLGDGFKGEVIDWRKEQSKKYRADEYEFLANGDPKMQYVITVKTHFRDWDRTAKPPKDQETGQELPASEDDGLRNIYIANQKSSNFGDVARAVVSALPDADDFKDAIGGTLAGKFTEEIDTGKGNPYQKYEYRYEPPKKEGGFQADTAEEREARADYEPPVDHTETNVEPPF